jgi:hypothetical protein
MRPQFTANQGDSIVPPSCPWISGGVGEEGEGEGGGGIDRKAVTQNTAGQHDCLPRGLIKRPVVPSIIGNLGLSPPSTDTSV